MGSDKAFSLRAQVNGPVHGSGASALSHLNLRVCYGIRAVGASPRTRPTASAVGSDPRAQSRRLSQQGISATWGAGYRDLALRLCCRDAKRQSELGKLVLDFGHRSQTEILDVQELRLRSHRQLAQSDDTQPLQCLA